MIPAHLTMKLLLFFFNFFHLSLKAIDAKYQKDRFLHRMYPTKTASLWAKSFSDHYLK